MFKEVFVGLLWTQDTSSYCKPEAETGNFFSQKHKVILQKAVMKNTWEAKDVLVLNI